MIDAILVIFFELDEAERAPGVGPLRAQQELAHHRPGLVELLVLAQLIGVAKAGLGVACLLILAEARAQDHRPRGAADRRARRAPRVDDHHGDHRRDREHREPSTATAAQLRTFEAMGRGARCRHLLASIPDFPVNHAQEAT
jgi:hypothetical protein